MHVAVFQGPGKPLAIQQHADPTPADDEMVLKVSRCGICGTDLHMTSGEGLTFPSGSVLGHEYAGEVVEVGRAVRRFKAGDWVSSLAITGCGRCANCLAGTPMWCVNGMQGAMGGYGQYNTVKEFSSIPLPRTVSAEDGALIEPLAVALHGVELARLEPGDKVIILGTGPIGLAAAFWARRLGAGKVLCASRSSRAKEKAYHMGAHLFQTLTDDFAAESAQALGGAADVVIDCIGMPGTLSLGLNAVRSRGTVILLGNCMKPDPVIPSQIMFKELTIRGSMVYSLKNFETVASVLDQGSLEPRCMVTDVVSMTELPRVFEELRQPTYQCKTLLDPWLERTT